MNIEIAEPGRMTQSGSSLLRLIQNNEMPVLDLFVRESVQNSLDAGIKNNPDCRYVDVSFLTGDFDHYRFKENLEGIQKALMKRFPGRRYSFLAVRDYNTTGLTGPMHFNDVKDNQYGNLLKLVYEISKPQEQSEAGGSWGLGKTVYFRIGIGMVLYYSRIKENGAYSSRLAVTLVENEKSQNSMIPSYKGMSRRGIAWWGEETGENRTQPLTDEAQIQRILTCFNIEPYKKDETGTTVVIPYIDQDRLLDNTIQDSEDPDRRPYWTKNIRSYLRIAVQRWYAPRLNNALYPYGLFLQTRIDGQQLAFEDMEPEFKIIQALYNRSNNVENPMGILHDYNRGAIRRIDINLRGDLNSQTAGTVSFFQADRTLLKMNPPDNLPSPYVFFNVENRDDGNRPIICYTRKPGMIVEYQTVGKWADDIPLTDPDHFLFAVFVLNSENTLKNRDDLTLEEYVRKGELADHASWMDYSTGKIRPTIISKIQKNIIKKIKDSFVENSEKPDSKLNSGLGKLFGDLLLPPDGFGRGPVPGKSKPPKDGMVERNRDLIFRLYPDKTEYRSHSIKLVSNLTAREKSFKECRLIAGVETEKGSVELPNWLTQTGSELPFDISRIKLNIKKSRMDLYIAFSAELTPSAPVRKSEAFTAELNLLSDGKGTGLTLRNSELVDLDAEIQIYLTMYRKDLKPALILEREDD